MIEVFGGAATALDNFITVSEIVSAGLLALVAVRVRGGVYWFALLQLSALLANMFCARSMLPLTGCAVIFVNASSAVNALRIIEWPASGSQLGRQYIRVLAPWMLGAAGTIAAYVRAYF